jgi:Flp pilus assembly protein TadG
MYRETRAVAALEFAMVAPVLLLMVMGMMCFGFYYTYLHELQELASSAARASVAGLNEAERDTLAKAYVANAVVNSELLSASDLTVSTGTSGTPAAFYEVTLAYNMKDTPLPLMAGFVHLNAANISRTSTIQFGYY